MVEKMVKIVGRFLVLFLSFVGASLSARVTMNVRVEGHEQNQVVIGQPFTLEVVIDEVYGSVPAPVIKGLDGCVYSLAGTYMSSINGKATARYSYNVRIDKLGIHTIGPAVVHHQQQELKSDQLQVEVVRDLGIVAQKNKSNVNVPAKAFLRLMIDSENVVVGQKMDCTLRFYYEDQSVSLQSVTIPELSGFDIKEIGKVETGTAEIEGTQYRYAQWRWDMYPMQAGEFIIPAYSADYDMPIKDNGNHVFGGFFVFMGSRVERKRVYSNAITLKVSPLPYFNGDVHAVGSFERISAEIKPGIAKEGEGMVLAIEIEGVGNLPAIAMPKLLMPDSLKYYDSNSAIIEPQYTDELPKKRFEFIVQALKSGDYEIPEQLFTYFDVERHSYITLRTSPLAVSIMPGVTSLKKDIATNTPQAEPKERTENQLKDINTTGPWYPVAARKPLPWWLFELLFLLPCMYLLYPLILNQCIALTGNSARLARRRMFKQARKRVELCIKSNNTKELYSIFTTVLHVGNETKSNHSTVVLLQKSGLSPELINEWNIFYERITHAAYAQSDVSAGSDVNDLCGMAKRWLELLEKNI